MYFFGDSVVRNPPARAGVQFSSVQFLSDSLRPSVCSMLDFPVQQHLLELLQTRVHPVHDAVQPSHLLSRVQSLSGEDPLEKKNSNPLQSSCLGNRMVKRAWRVIAHGVENELDTI